MSAGPGRPPTSAAIGRRVLTSIVGLPIVVGALFLGPPWWTVLLALSGAVATDEYIRLVLPRAVAVRRLAIVAAALLPIVATGGGTDGLARAFVVLVLVSLLGWIVQLRRGTNDAAEVAVGQLLAGLLLPGAGIVAFAVLRDLDAGIEWTALVIAATWGNDTAAFLIGRAWGRHRVAPRISPGKSWEGLIAGALASGALALASAPFTPGLAWSDRIGVGVLAATVGPVGDFAKSMVKRSHGAKDFGRLLPGHGGILDRIDALVFVAPCVMLWATWLRCVYPAS